MANFYQKLQAKATAAGFQKNSKESLKWYQKALKGMMGLNRKELLDEFDRSKPLSGRMFHFFYDPKGKKTLPYYDRFPLIFFVEQADGGFYGLNLHYLPHKERAIFFDRLLDYTNNKRYDESTRLRLKYDLLKGSSKLKYFAPCFKRYLTKHVKSKIVEVPADRWESVIFLPSESFQKASKSSVWQESKTRYK
jgi:hypothetical protein